MFEHKLSKRVQLFSDNTTVHGFNELYYTRNRFWFFFWLVIQGAAIGVTIYQVQGSIRNFLKQNTVTLMTRATAEDVMYPSLKICYPHWMYWVNWSKAYELGFTNDTILFGLSYLTPIYSVVNFDVSLAEENFFTTLERNNVSRVLDFYMAIMIDPSQVVISRTFYPSSIALHMDYYGYPKLCLIYSEKIILKELQKNDVEKIRSGLASFLDFHLDYKVMIDQAKNLDSNEYTMYMMDWITYESNENIANLEEDSADAILPLMIFPNSHDDNGIAISVNNDFYNIDIKSKINKWKSKSNQPCQPYRWIAGNVSCLAKCEAEIWLKTNKIELFLYLAMLLNEKNMENVFAFSIKFISGNVSDKFSMISEELIYDEDKLFEKTDQYRNHVIQCQNICRQMIGCVVHYFDISLRTMSLYDRITAKTSTRFVKGITIKYPSEYEIVMMCEDDAQTWEGFIGNVGGLLGIWLGASVLSLIQIFYLCLCARSD